MRSAGHVSSWTPAAYGQPRGSDEEEKDELLAVPIQLRTPAQWARLRELIRWRRRTVMLPVCGCARRLFRQRHVRGWYSW